MKITTIDNYYEELYKRFPEVPKEDIKRIVVYGWKSLYLHNSYGGDTLICDNDLWCYIGRLSKNPLDHFYYYVRKLTTRLRVLYRRRKIEWDGYYYFGLTENAYLKYIALKCKKGRPKKKFNYGGVYLYQMLDECKISEHSSKYIFRVPFISKISFKFYVPEFITDKAELIITRDTLKFKDILTCYNKYDVI